MPSEWTILTLKELMETRLASQEHAVAAAFAASEKAIVKAESAQTAYNARSNEFRASLDDQNKTMLPRTEADARFTQLRDLMDGQAKMIVELQKSESRGEGGSSAVSVSKANSQWLIYLIVIVALEALNGLAFLIFWLATRS